MLILLAVSYAVICTLMYLLQRRLIYFPQPAAIATPANSQALKLGEVTLQISVQQNPGRQAVLYFGGNAEDVSQTLAPLSVAFPGRALYLPHYRGYGGSAGNPSEAALVSDGLKLFDWVHRQHPDITLIGRSLGSGVAIQVAAQRPASKLVLVTPYDSIQRMAQQQFPWLPVSLLLADKYESWRYVAALKMPTMLIMAGDDRVIPQAHTLALWQQFPAGQATLHTLAGIGHNDIGDAPAYLRLLAQP
ncbi:alpha/beta hydrolase [Andreprevotia sp. IGB-42]|uniref:alpha/beta hydrolase n=1 Tax=Andreprevotia sp. IGB-42 TaxID=2497473 RepID=UPI00191E5B3D|nr:alpha/beta hydrolase [Andreprevotia sp. IGB-42]